MNFATNLSILGQWWIPGGKEKYQGELAYKQSQGIVLHIFGAFNGVSELTTGSDQVLLVIFGIDRKGNCYTLLNAIGHTYGKIEFFQSQFEIEIALSSSRRNFYDISKLEVKGFRFSTNFFNPFFYRYRNTPEGPWLQNRLLQLSLEEDPNLELGNFDSYYTYFYFSYDFGYEDQTLRNDFYLTQDVFLCAEFKNEIDLSEALSEANFLKDFFSFFCYRQVSFKKFLLITSKKEEPEMDDICFACLFAERSSKIGQLVHIDHVLLPFMEFGEEQLRTALKNWVASRNFISNGLNLYMAVVYLRLSLPVQAFLNIVFAIETFHKNYFVPDCYLRIRIKELIDSNNDILGDYLLDPNDFCDKVVKQRNYLAHDHSVSSAAIADDEYNYYISVLKMLFEISFLRKLGISIEALQFLISKNMMYKHFRYTK